MSDENLPAKRFETKMGPAMASLPNDRQRAFVDALFQLPSGHGSGAKAARMAGYTGDPATLTATGNRLRRDPAILAAIEEETKSRFLSLGPAAVQSYITKLNNVADKDNHRAAKHVLDTIMPPETRVSGEIRHKHEVMNHDQQAVEDLQFMQKMGWPEEKLIENFGVTGLERYRKMIAIQDAAASLAAKPIIEGEIIEPEAEPDPDYDLLYGDSK